MNISNKLILSNHIKNGIVLVLAIIVFPLLSNSLKALTEVQLANFLLVVSVLIMTLCFANFAFTYERSNLMDGRILILSHMTTGLYMFLLAVLLEGMYAAVSPVYPFLSGATLLFGILLYIGLMLYDYWDLLRYIYEHQD